VTVGTHQKIFWLDVAMNDVVLMAKVDGLE
jgi:hypothetical protein